MGEILLAWFAKAMVVNTHWIHLTEYMAHNAAFAGGVHALQHDEHAMRVAMDAIGIHEPLIVGYFGAAVGNEPLTSLLVTVKPRFRPGIDVDQMRM